MKYLKIYGLQRSGTNFLKYLIEQNFDCFVLQNWLGWKHGRVVFLKENEQMVRDLCHCELTPEQKAYIKFSNTPRIAIRKNIHAWLVSYQRYKKFNWKNHKKIIDMYYDMYKHYEANCYMVRYEDLLTDPISTLTDIMIMFDLKMRGEAVKRAIQIMPRAGDDHSDTWKLKYSNKEFNVDYYLNKQYMNDIPNNVIKYIEDYERQ